MIKRKLFTLFLIAATINQSFAAGNGLSGINEATSMARLSVLSAVSRSIPSGRAVIPTPPRLPPHGSEHVSF